MKYSFDTSFIIDLHRNYPEEIFKSLWNNIYKMIEDKRIISPREVYNELEKKDDITYDWAKRNKSIFKKPDNCHQKRVSEIVNEFEKLIDLNRETPQADPYVIAFAICEDGCVVATSERRAGNYLSNPQTKPKIPNICDHYEIECVNIVDFIKMEGWSF